MVGWIKAHRAIQDHWIFSDAEKYRAWMIILFTVNFESKKVNIKNTVFECKRGESLLSLDSWAKSFGNNWNKSKVRRFFKLLENDSMIVSKSEHKTTRLTVCNYETYQDERNADETEMKRKRNANETQTAPTKEGEEVKKVKNDKKYLLTFEKVKEDFTLNSEFEKVIKNWLTYKNEKKQSYKETGLRSFIKKLLGIAKNESSVAEKIIEQSMSNNWAGIFELKNNYSAKNQPTSKIGRTIQASKEALEIIKNTDIDLT
jgi:hypothetical protein